MASNWQLISRSKRGFLTGLSACLAVATPPLRVRAQSPSRLTIFAAASLKTALDDAQTKWFEQSGTQLAISYAASSTLAKQIEQDAPTDMFISADLEWMDYLASKSCLRADTRTNLLGNTLVLIAPKQNARPLKIEPGFDLANALRTGRLAVADTASVPAGKYAKAALEHLGIWQSVSSKLAQTENVRTALRLVSRGEAPFGIVYLTDAIADQSVSVVGVFPSASHPPIIYPVAITANSSHPDATRFLAFLKSPAAASIFSGQGFTVLP